MTPSMRIYHNPRCSKSRTVCSIIRDKGLRAEVIEYLHTPPTRTELVALLAKLRMRPAEIVRTGEAVFKAEYKGRELSDEQWLDALVAHPILIERPIVVVGNRAIVARPPERVLELL
jgi:arsenate reductase (glutaredoxin)